MQDVGNDERINPAVLATADTYQRCRALVARLRMRPHAGDQLVQQADAAASAMFEAITNARLAAFTHRANDYEREIKHVDAVIEAVERGYERTRAYETLAREAIAELLGPTSAPTATGLLARVRLECQSEFRGLF